MKLSDAQVGEFHEQGYLFLPQCFTPAEIAVLKTEATKLYDLDRPEVWKEENGAPRTVFAAHTFSEPFGRLGAHPRLLGPVTQLLDGQVYMHQYKVNAKAAFDGDVWQWHQDYGTWSRDDLMPEPRAMNIALFLDNVSAVNGPLMVIPRSHRDGVYQAGHDLATTSYPLWTLDRATIRRLADTGGIVAPTGPAGSVLMFHCNLVHASPPNISPWPRTIAYLSLCEVNNHIRQFKRPEWVAHRNFAPIIPLADNCLSDLAAQNPPVSG